MGNDSAADELFGLWTSGPRRGQTGEKQDARFSGFETFRRVAVEHLQSCTLPEKILLVAAELEAGGQSPFTAELLIVSVWQKYPRTFGLKGYDEQFPDSNRVLSLIMGEKGLPRRGWLAKVGQKLYHLTTEGKQLSERLRQGDPASTNQSPRQPRELTLPTQNPRESRIAPHRKREQQGQTFPKVFPQTRKEPTVLAQEAATTIPSSVVPSVTLPRSHDLLLQSLLANPAYQKFRKNALGESTFTEAVRFWGLGDRTGDAVDERLSEVQKTLAACEKLFERGPQTLGNSRLVSAREISELLNLQEHLLERFHRHLTLLRKRGER